VKALQNLHAENPDGLKGLVLDLRNNPGGLVDTAAEVADHFIGEGKDDGTIVTMKGRAPNAIINHFAKVGEKEPRYPIVVLINGGSASASEILAGALQDNRRAIIMGTQSYGKGSVQSIIPLRDGYGLKLTTARYYTPKGRSIQAQGITPDVIVGQLDMTKQKKNNGNNSPEEYGEKFLLNHLKGEPEKSAPPNSAPKGKPVKPSSQPAPTDEIGDDYQLSRALEMLKGLTVFSQVVKNRTTAPVPVQTAPSSSSR
jgi:carboxyl-terminal processing protease